MAEIRTTSSTGGQKGVKAERYDLLPREGIEAIARVFAFGATKYADHNWRRGYEWGKSYAAMQRHLNAFWAGETYDEESGEPHLAHAGFHVLVLLTWLQNDGEGSTFDDRYRPEESAAEEEVRLLDEQAALDSDYTLVTLNPETGSSSDIPMGLGDLTHDVEDGEEIFAPFPETDVRAYAEEINRFARLAAYALPVTFAVDTDGGIERVQGFGPDLLSKRRPRI